MLLMYMFHYMKSFAFSILHLSMVKLGYSNLLEFYYDGNNSLCQLTSVVPHVSDDMGMVAPPYVSFVQCDEDVILFGYNERPFRVYFTNNDEHYSTWVQAGTLFNISVKNAYFTGGQFKPLQGLAYEVTSSYQAPLMREYTKKNVVIQHDTHVNEGNSSTIDLLWSDVNDVAPDLVIVAGCMNTSDEEYWVKDHFHPKGALYISLVGTLCFIVEDVKKCISPFWEEPCDDCVGSVRWVSPLLRYNETFRSSNKNSTMVNEMLGYSCMHPYAFAVEKFNYMKDDTLPNFVDIPGDTMVVYDSVVYSKIITL